jgi:hypothetical protein
LIAPATTPWVYPEFEGYHGQLNWLTLQTTEVPITVVTPVTNLFFCVLTPPATDVANVNPVYPAGALSFLHGIAPQGEKFHAASGYAPSSAQNTATGLYTGEVDFFFGPLPASGADRDGNGLIDVWELQYFGALGQDPLSRADPDHLPLMVENALDFSPTNNNLNSPRLPRLAPATNAPVALTYGVPDSQGPFYNYLPQLSDDLQTWVGIDQHPEYFNVQTNTDGATVYYFVQPIVSAWPGDQNRLFLRLKIEPKP